MEASELLNLISGGETSTLQLKENMTNVVSIAQEMVAFSNSKGGKILIGVNDKNGELTGLSFQDIQRINNLLTTAANEQVKSAIVIETETLDVQGKKVIVTHISEGIDKPYMDKDGLIFVKNGTDKRKVTSKEELSRLLQSSGNLYTEEILIANSSYEDVHVYRFEEFYTQKYKLPFEKENLGDLIENLNLGKEGKLNLAGALLFTRHPQRNIPAFFITAIWFRGNDLWETNYLSSNNFVGTLSEQYEKAYAFVTNAMTKLQAGQSFNSLGKSEIPEIVIQELLTNALIHRDYFIKDTIKAFIFQNRVEIKSPGKLPNNLTEEQIKRGIRKKRNPILDSFAPDLLNYRGAGSGILRALQAYPHIDLSMTEKQSNLLSSFTAPKSSYKKNRRLPKTENPRQTLNQ